MQEIGTVIAMGQKTAKVKFMRKTSCDSCHACTLNNTGDMVTEVVNTVGAQVGNKVKVNLAPQVILTAAMVVYGLPILALFVGYYIGQEISHNFGLSPKTELYGVLGSATGLIIAFFIVRIIDKWMKSRTRFYPEIIEIIPE